jgi:hypothetical protein
MGVFASMTSSSTNKGSLQACWSTDKEAALVTCVRTFCAVAGHVRKTDRRLRNNNTAKGAVFVERETLRRIDFFWGCQNRRILLHRLNWKQPSRRNQYVLL